MQSLPSRIFPPFVSVSLLLGSLAAVTGCAGLQVHTDYDSALDFSNFETFAWLEAPVLTTASDGVTDVEVNPFAVNSMLDARVRAAVERELDREGYRPAPDGATPSFQLQYHVILKDKTRISTTAGPYYGGYWGAGRYGGFAGSTQSFDYQEGTLIIDLVDPETQRIAWRGWAVGNNREGYYDEERVAKVVNAILSEFPPGDAAGNDPGDAPGAAAD